jgi:trigger factor
MDKLVEKAVMEVPEVMYEARLDEMQDEMENRFRMQGMTTELYLQYTKQTMEGLRESWLETAQKDVKGRLVLEAVAKKEAFVISEDDIKNHLDELAKANNQDADDLYKRLTPERRKDLEYALGLKKAQEFILEKAIAVDGE